MKTTILLIFLAVAVLNPAEIWALGGSHMKLHEQSVFGAEDETVDRPVRIPPGALEILAKDADVARELRTHHLPPDRIPDTWLLASALHLDGKQEVGYVVIGRGFLAGANVTTFWIFSKTKDRVKLILTAPAQTLHVHMSLTHGYRDIEIGAVVSGKAASVHYHFDGNVYQSVQNTSAVSH